MKKWIAILLSVAILFSMAISVSAANPATAKSAEAAAEALYKLDLFLGTGMKNGMPIFSLENKLTRAHAIVLLVRMLGKEAEAEKTAAKHPFTDTASWYDAHVGYAYANGYTKGTGSKTYSGSSPTNGKMFATFCLRALGYSDKKSATAEEGDFWWDDAIAFAKSLDIGVSAKASYTRGDAVKTFWDVLNTKMKDGTQTLAEKLIKEGVFTDSQFKLAKQYASGELAMTQDPSTGCYELPEVEINTSSKTSTSTQTQTNNSSSSSSASSTPKKDTNELPEKLIG